MPYIDLYIAEKEYYKIHTGHTRALVVPSIIIETASAKDFFEAHIHCVYPDGKIDNGRHISPLFRTIMQIQKEVTGIEKGNYLIHLK